MRDWQQQDEIQNNNIGGASELSISSSAASVVVPKAELFKRSISESPNPLTASRETLTGSNLNISTSRPNISASSSSNKFGSTFSIVKHKKIDLTSFNEERPEEQKTPERRKSGTDDYVLEENVLKKAASINLDHSFSGKEKSNYFL